jgi:osmotically-inducible protein OsmY
MAARRNLSGLLAAATLGVAALVASSDTLAQANSAAASRSDSGPEVVVTATREADARLAAKVAQALDSDPYLFTGHISVSAEGGIVRVEGMVEDPSDMLQILRLARRIAGKRRVINEIEVTTGSVDHD